MATQRGSVGIGWDRKAVWWHSNIPGGVSRPIPSISGSLVIPRDGEYDKGTLEGKWLLKSLAYLWFLSQTFLPVFHCWVWLGSVLMSDLPRFHVMEAIRAGKENTEEPKWHCLGWVILHSLTFPTYLHIWTILVIFKLDLLGHMVVWARGGKKRVSWRVCIRDDVSSRKPYTCHLRR